MLLEATAPHVEVPALDRAVDAAIRAIPPAWPLAASVAVNPFLGQAEDTLAEAGARLRRVAGVAVTMPRALYLEKLAAGQVTGADLAEALAAAPAALRPVDTAALRAAAALPAPRPEALPTVADLAAQASGVDWPRVIAERLGAWAAGYFDEGQALWSAPRGKGAYAAWRGVATHDLTPEILGLGGFAGMVAAAPERSGEALADAVQRLGLPVAAGTSYFHQLLTTLGGWAQYARYRLWQAELVGGSDDAIADCLAIRLLWEVALLERYGARIAARWREIAVAHAAPVVATADDVVDAILQSAVERAAQREIADQLIAAAPPPTQERPALQAVFCIDVRSEVFRRALEAQAPECQTLGFAGFFGMATAHRRFASDVAEPRLPVLLTPGVHSCAGGAATSESDRMARIRARAERAWGRFKLAAVSSFAFVEATGPVYAGKLLRDSLSLGAETNAVEPMPQFRPALDLAARTQSAEKVLRAMSLTTGFARLVLVVGHGAEVVNNPHANSLNCGACGGYAGDVNARLLAGLLNDPAVREGLAARDVHIPADTLFVAGLHDTTSDRVSLFAADHPVATHRADLAQARSWLDAAGAASRKERAARLPRAGRGETLLWRGRDWAEIRPEWGLAGCRAFIAAPRRLTRGKPLDGRVFLHDYDWKSDTGFSILELILTAPAVVASWISLQYYGSTVAPGLFGGGNKLLHNIVGGIGVLEGNGGLLRAGIPWQSVHDGAGYVHEPLRLTVFVAAPTEAISAILGRHDGVRALFANQWMQLLATDDHGRVVGRYGADGRWTPQRTDAGDAVAPTLVVSTA